MVTPTLTHTHIHTHTHTHWTHTHTHSHTHTQHTSLQAASSNFVATNFDPLFPPPIGVEKVCFSHRLCWVIRRYPERWWFLSTSLLSNGHASNVMSFFWPVTQPSPNYPTLFPHLREWPHILETEVFRFWEWGMKLKRLSMVAKTRWELMSRCLLERF